MSLTPSRAAAGGALSLFVLAAAFTLPGPLVAQTAEQVLSQALDRYEQRMAGVQDVTIQQEVMGFSSTVYLVRETVDGRAVLRPRTVQAAAGVEMDPTEDLSEVWADPGALFDEHAHRWTLEGESTVGDRPAWRLELTDFTGIDWAETAPGQDEPFEPTRMVIELDRERFVPLTMLMEGEVLDAGEAHPVRVNVRFEDYREVDGYLHPFRTVTETDLAETGLSPEEVAEAQQALEELREHLRGMPEEQRRMMESAMGDQLQQLERMAAGDGFEVEVVVTDLRVNAGPPGGA